MFRIFQILMKVNYDKINISLRHFIRFFMCSVFKVAFNMTVNISVTNNTFWLYIQRILTLLPFKCEITIYNIQNKTHQFIPMIFLLSLVIQQIGIVAPLFCLIPQLCFRSNLKIVREIAHRPLLCNYLNTLRLHVDMKFANIALMMKNQLIISLKRSKNYKIVVNIDQCVTPLKKNY